MATASEIVIVLGCHRLGTSVFTSVLQDLGVYLDEELLPPSKDNPKGYFESSFITETHDKILKCANATWHTRWVQL